MIKYFQLIVFAVFYAGNVISSPLQPNDDYLGTYIGNLSELRHVVAGEVFAVNAKTFYIRNFSYDGVAPALFFYATTGDAPNGKGFRVKDAEYDGLPMRRYKNEGVLLSLPEDVRMSDIKFVYVWCEKFKINFGDVPLPENFVDYPKPQRLTALKGPYGISSDPIIFLDAVSLLIPNLFYDGKSPNARFWVSPRGHGLNSLSPHGLALPDENNNTYPLRQYNGKNIIIRLPEDKLDFPIGHFGIWDKDFTASFAQIQVPLLENLPPAVSALKLTPWKVCSNCDEQIANFKISKIPTLTSYENNPTILEREYMTIQARVPANRKPPKTYYETPVYSVPSSNVIENVAGEVRRNNFVRDTGSQRCVAMISGQAFYLVPYS